MATKLTGNGFHCDGDADDRREKLAMLEVEYRRLLRATAEDTLSTSIVDISDIWRSIVGLLPEIPSATDDQTSHRMLATYRNEAVYGLSASAEEAFTAYEEQLESYQYRDNHAESAISSIRTYYFSEHEKAKDKKALKDDITERFIYYLPTIHDENMRKMVGDILSIFFDENVDISIVLQARQSLLDYLANFKKGRDLKKAESLENIKRMFGRKALVVSLSNPESEEPATM